MWPSAAGAAGAGHIALIAGIVATGVVTTTVVTDSAGLTDNVEVLLNGVPVGQSLTLLEQLAQLPTSVLFGILGTLFPATITALQDPRTVFYAALVMLPAVIVVLMVLRRKRQG